MAYIDYSTHFVLDQFFTYLEANVLGSNDEHLYDSLAVEHNINTATVDGTHKANSITGSMINTTPVSTGSQLISGLGTWTPTVGVYQIVSTPGISGGDNLRLELYISGSWRDGSNVGGSSPDGIIFCDGTNMRFLAGSSSVTVYYQKF